MSVLSVGEIAKGIGLLKEGERKRSLQAWLQTLQNAYQDPFFLLISKRVTFGVKLRRLPKRRAKSSPPATDSLPLRRSGMAFVL